MEKINELLEQRQKYMAERQTAQSDWFIEMLDDMIFNIDLELKQLTPEE